MKKTLTAPVVALMLCLSGCGIVAEMFATPEAAEAGGVEAAVSAGTGWINAAEAAMVADGIDPATADVDAWKLYGSKVGTARGIEVVQAPTPEGEDVPWWKTVGQLVLAYLSVKGTILGGQVIGGAVTGTPSRATDNLGVILAPETSWADTARAVLALLGEFHSPAAATEPDPPGGDGGAPAA